MRTTVLTLALTVACGLLGQAAPAIAAGDDNVLMPVLIMAQQEQAATINNLASLVALKRSDRDARSWKTGFVVPGRETRFYYEWLLEDGNTVLKVENHKIKGVKDERPLEQSHPNLSITFKAIGITAGPLTAAMVTAKKL